ncbi:TetR family transcriptional regulator [Viridibacillus sp. YIM B01967]|uniref:TetR family transcriptional regulator n=1 Tax=Viridibacillus soli TaxID=2798301 RepID=A0ABS1H5D0_9BACL|nr:TetR family transcriptional regulator [Viridibacillus soli]MBK3494253.1 TetR family transcriptional regulator [Viridibacillus soli]
MQIMQAAIMPLDEIGFVKISLSQIAKRAGIFTALVSYHFSGKSDLMNYVLIEQSMVYNT